MGYYRKDDRGHQFIENAFNEINEFDKEGRLVGTTDMKGKRMPKGGKYRNKLTPDELAEKKHRSSFGFLGGW